MACGGDDEPKFPEVLEIKEGDLALLPATSELVVGENRLAFGILGPEGRPLVDAKVHLTFYDLNDGKQVKKAEMDAVSRVIARDAGINETVDHIHADGATHKHVNAGDDRGVYTAMVNFDRGGRWGLEIEVESESPKLKETILAPFNVFEQGFTPALGSPAPRTRNVTINDVADISQIDSSAKPSPLMHTTTIADAIAAGRPALVLFAVPGYCESLLCGPELEIMRKLYPRYEKNVEFIHVEFFDNPGASNRQPVAAAREWNLRTEPWFFVIDAKGNIAAKFEGPTSLQELEQALQKVAPGS